MSGTGDAGFTWLLGWLVLAVAVGTVWADEAGVSGRHPVGFRVEEWLDTGRFFRSATGMGLTATPGRGARPIQASVWYPAAAGAAGGSMTYREYLELSARARDHLPLSEDRRRRVTAELAAWRVGRGLSADGVEEILARPMGAHRDAPGAAGRYPLLLFLPGFAGFPHDFCLWFERLASHGYIVAAIPSLPLRAWDWGPEPWALDAQARDLEYVWARVTDWPSVDPDRLAVGGFSRGGAVAFWVGVRHQGVRAVVAVDAAWGAWESGGYLSDVEPADPARLRAPLLLLEGDRPKPPGAFGRAAHADRWRVCVPGLAHLDFLSSVHIQSAGEATPVVEARAGGQDLATDRLVAFLDLHLRGDASARSRLEAETPGVGVERQAAVPAPTEEGYVHLAAAQGGAALEAAFGAVREQVPGHRPAREAVLAELGAGLRAEGRIEDALAVARVRTSAFPASTSAWLDRARLEAVTGDQEAAIESLERLLAQDPTHEPARWLLNVLSDPPEEGGEADQGGGGR